MEKPSKTCFAIILCGVNDTQIQRMLLAEPEPSTFKRAFEVAQVETSKRDIKDLVVAQGHNAFHQMQRVPGKAVIRQTNCYRCKGKHDPATCKFKAAKCHCCGKI